MGDNVIATTFKKARENGSSFVFLVIFIGVVREIVMVPRDSFDAKEYYYLKNFGEDLFHRYNRNISIEGLSYGEIEELYNFA